jgi:hypothetical protein
MHTTALDWPLSREEKKGQLMRLYNSDVEAADVMIGSGNKALEALRDELDTLRAAAGVRKSCPTRLPDEVESPRAPADSTEDEVKRLHQAVENAAAVLRAILPIQDEEDLHSPRRCRARSEGAAREVASSPHRPALRRTPRQSGTPRRRVSFGPQPEEEPHDLEEQNLKLAGSHPGQSSQKKVQSEEKNASHDKDYFLHKHGDHHSCTPGNYAADWPKQHQRFDQYYHAPPPHSGYGIATPRHPHAAPDLNYTWYSGAPSYNYPSQPHGWASQQCQPYQQVPSRLDLFVEVSPEIKPAFHELRNGVFEMLVPGAWIRVATNCIQNVSGVYPHHEFNLALSEVQRVIFDPWANMPPNARAWCQAHKVVLVLEMPSQVAMNTKLKTNSPYGSLVVTGSSTVLNYRLQVDGQLAACRNASNMGANRLELELDFTFDCYIGPPVAEPNKRLAISNTSEGFVFREGPAPVHAHPCMHKSGSESHFA